MKKLIKTFSALEKGTSPASILFPWIPSRSKKLRTQATGSLYQILNSYVELRRNDPETTLDAIDVFIADGYNNPTIVAVRENFTELIMTIEVSLSNPVDRHEHLIRRGHKYGRQWRVPEYTFRGLFLT